MRKNLECKLAAPFEYSARYNDEKYVSYPYRSEFQRDRDRLLYSKEFRRLSGKTQVFLPASHDHVRTRLTHTLEVSQISRVTANNLGLDPALAEAIALGHDVGHTPFGHVGEKTLSFIMNGCDGLASFQKSMEPSHKGFKHNLQGLRVTSDLEQMYGKNGLNLTNFTLWGIKNHTSDRWKTCGCYDSQTGKCYLKRNPVDCENKGVLNLDFYEKYYSLLLGKMLQGEAWSFEGQVVKFADEIAQRHHDIEDAVFMGIIPNEEMLEEIKGSFEKHFDDEDRSLFDDLKKCAVSNSLFLPLVSKFIVGLLNKKLINNSKTRLDDFVRRHNINSPEDFSSIYPHLTFEEVAALVTFPEDFQVDDEKFHAILKDRILNSFEVQRMDGKGRFVLRRLVKAYVTNPKQLHDATIYYVFRLFNPSLPQWSQISKTDLGSMRNEIDSPDCKSDATFQIALLRGICDHLAGMTDSFALAEYEKLYG